MKFEQKKRKYIKIYCPNHPNAKCGYILKHRIVVEKKLGRYLKPAEVIHHLDENKQNNDIDNLMLFPTQKAHASFHTKIRQHGITNPIKRQIKNRWEDINNLEML